MLIRGFEVKQAALTHIERQLTAAVRGCLNGGSVRVRFNGTTARVSYVWSGNTVTLDVQYPVLADNSWLTAGESDIFHGMTLHELCHVLFTDNWYTRKMGFEAGYKNLSFHLWNGFEDPRIEQAGITHGNAAGAKQLFLKLLNRLTGSIGPSWNPTQLIHAPFAICLLGREALGNGNEYTRTLLARIPEPYQSLYQWAADQFQTFSLDRTGTRYAHLASQEFLKRWLALGVQKSQPDARPPQDTPQEFTEQEQHEQSSEEFEDQGDDSGMDGDGKDREPKPDAGDQQEQYEDGSEGRDESEDGSEGGAGNGAEDDSEGAGDEIGDETGEDGSTSEDDGDDIWSSEPGSGAGNDPFDISKRKFKDSNVQPVEPSVDEIFKRVWDRTDNHVNLPDFRPGSRKNLESAINIKPGGREAMELRTGQLAGAARAQLARILTAPDRVGWDPLRESGRFDSRRGHRLLAGSEAVFKQRWETQGLDTAVTVLTDMSGSMSSGGRSQCAADCTYLIAKACEQNQTPVEIVGFTSSSLLTYGAYQPMDAGGNQENKRLKSTQQRLREEAEIARDHGLYEVCASDTCDLLYVKGFNERVAQAADRIYSIDHACLGGTPDYSAVRSMIQTLALRPEKRKVLFVITDGDSYSPSELAKLSLAHEITGVTVVAIGVGGCDPNRFKQSYPTGIAINDAADLAKNGLSILAKALEKSAGKRRVS